MDTRPIGIFDSGLGGVSVLREAIRLLPNENYIYYGDNRHAPYGDKSEEEIFRLSFSCADFLVSRGVKAMLLACNTATGMSIREIRDKLSIPVVSIEPAIKPACSIVGEGKVLMLATLATTKMQRYHTLQARMPDPNRVINIPCSGLVERIENGIFAPDAYDDLLNSYLGNYAGIKVDAIVLGCTHYVFIADAIYRYAKKHFCGECKIYDGNIATVCQLGRVLAKNRLNNTEGCANVEFYTSGEFNNIKPIFDMLLFNNRK